MSVRSQVLKAIDANPGLPHHVLARKVAADVGEEALIALAVERIERIIVAERRRRTRNLEDQRSEVDTTSAGDQWAAIDALLDEFRRNVIVDWTADLLGSEFAVGDGTRVTWGEATAEQHIARIHLQTQNVRGSLEDIQRHEAALRHLAESGASCLNEAVRP